MQGRCLQGSVGRMSEENSGVLCRITSLRAAVVISGTMVNTQAHAQFITGYTVNLLFNINNNVVHLTLCEFIEICMQVVVAVRIVCVYVHM